jgi:flagellar motility protein MotE (MotC chaperone)
MAGALAFATAAILTWQFHSPPAVETRAPARKSGPSWDFHNPEVDLLISELNREREQLSAKKAELGALETRLQAERAELRKLIESADLTRRDIDALLTRVQEEEVANLKRLARIYANMSPEGAVAIFKELEDPAVVKLMSFMREAETAPILETLALSGETEARRVAGISERLRLVLNDVRRTQFP